MSLHAVQDIAKPLNPEEQTDRMVRALIVATIAGLVFRLVLSAMSIGSYDALLWRDFAQHIRAHGLLETYRTQPAFNHPPLPGLWAAMSLAVGQWTHLRFAFIFKLPMIAADAIVCGLIWKIVSRRASRRFAAISTCAFAWNPAAILISAYHCNTDSIYAMLALLAVYLIEDRGAFLLGGLALAAAINIKLIPAILIIPLAGTCRDWRSLRQLLIGLTIGAIPFVPVLALSGGAFVAHAISYTPPASYWGVQHFLLEMVRLPRFSGWAQPLLNNYQNFGRILLLLVSILATLHVRRHHLNRYLSCAVVASLFLIVAPGFALQYIIFPLPLLMVVAPWRATIYGACAGVGALFVYYFSSAGGWPLSSLLGGPDNPAPGPLFGLLAWATLIAFAWKAVNLSDWRIARLPALRPRVAMTTFVVILALGLGVRELLAWYSIGSADTMNLFPFGQRLVDGRGLCAVYGEPIGHNYGPMSACWIAGAIGAGNWLDRHAPGRWGWYPFVLRQPMILGDLLSAVLLYRIWRGRGETTAIAVATLFLFVPVSILISAFHGNYDSLVAMLCLLSCDLLGRQKRPLLAGAALGLAINVKPLPVLFVLPMLACCRNRRELWRFVAGLALLALPFVPPLVLCGSDFLNSVAGYHPEPDNWGVFEFLREAMRRPELSAAAQAIERAYSERGRFLVIGAMVLLAVWTRRTKAQPLHVMACAASLFLLFASGFGLQYLAIATPLLFAISPTCGFAYGLTAGLFALFNYWLNWMGGIPIDSTGIATSPRAPGPQFGLLAWATLVAFVCTTLANRISTRHASGLFPISGRAARS